MALPIQTLLQRNCSLISTSLRLVEVDELPTMYMEVNVLWVDQQVHCRQLSSSLQSGTVLWDSFPKSLDNQSVDEEFIYLTVHYTSGQLITTTIPE